jgi:aminopeptidase N
MRSAALLLCVVSGISLFHAQALFPVRDEGETRSRSYHVVHYRIEVAFDEAARKVIGKVTTTLVPFLPGLQHVVFDAEEMEFKRVSLRNGHALSYTVQPATIDILLDRPYSYRDTITLVTEYSCTPRRGLYFIQPDSAYPNTPRQIWTQGEDMDNHFWFPCYDFPNDRATSEVLATVRSSYTVLSNGVLAGVQEDPQHQLKTFHWKLSKPHASYLVMLAIGEYAVLKDSAGHPPLEYYVYRGQEEDARACFSATPDIMRFFSATTGVPFPWDKYAQALIHDFTVGGMENTSACSLLDHIAVYDARQRTDHSSTSLIAHELAHQWWGDLVTCKDWRHIWLNESFASYFDLLYHEHLLGRDEFDLSMDEAQLAGINADKTLGRKPIVSVGSYGVNVYPRGASVLHMLRYVLGDSLFFRSLHHYLTKHQYTVVETHDLKIAVEEATGQNLYWFFDQWVYRAGHPVFDVSYTWDDTSRTVLLHIAQTQTLDSLTGIFRTPVDIEITTATGQTVHRIDLTSKDTVVALPSTARPRLVIFDRGNWLLKELHFTKSDAEWLTQLAEARNPADRYRALRQIGTMPRNELFIPAVIDRALHDPMARVRREAITMLGLMADEQDSVWTTVKTAILAAAHDARAVVRAAAISLLTDSTDAEVRKTLYGALEDSSYTVVARTLGALAKADPRGCLPVIARHLGMPSHEEIIATAALDALANVDSTAGIAAAQERLQYGTPTQLRGTALWILRRFIRTGTVPESTLYPLTTDLNISLRMNDVHMLGEWGSPAALPLLELVAADPKNPSAEAARKGIDLIKKRVDHRSSEPP